MNSEKKILVSGSSKGIGLAICQRLLANDYRVLGIARSAPNELLNNVNYEHESLDLSDISVHETQLKNLAKKHTDVTGLINNAGKGMFGSLEEFSISQIHSLIQLNLLSAIALTRHFLPLLKRQTRADIIFIGSEAALHGSRYGSVYSASKFGLRGFAQALKHECASTNTHVGVINPGMVRSHFFEQLSFQPGNEESQALAPSDVAEAVLHMLQAKNHSVIEEITLNPRHRVVQKKKK